MRALSGTLDDAFRRQRLALTPSVKQIRAEQRVTCLFDKTPTSQPCGTCGVGRKRKRYLPVGKVSRVSGRAGRIEKSVTLTRAPTRPHTGSARGASSSN